MTLTALLTGGALAGTHESPPFFLLTDTDNVYVMLGKVPEGTDGFNVYRKEHGESEYRLLTPEPVRAVSDPTLFRSMIGEDYEWVRESTRGEGEFQVLRRIMRDSAMRVAFSFSSVRLGVALGKLYIDEKVKLGQAYDYRVGFVNYRNDEFSTAEKTCRVERARVPDPPFDLVAEAGDSQVRLDWGYKELEAGFDYITAGFYIYRKAEGETEFTRVNPFLHIWFEDLNYRIDHGIENGVRYTYYLTAVDVIGTESAPSNRVEVIPVDLTPPSIPYGLVTKEIGDTIVVGWRMSPELDLSHYNIYRGTSIQGDFAKLNSEPVRGDLPYYEDAGVRAGKLYFYKVGAVDRVGNESMLTSAISAMVKDVVPPGVPSDLQYAVEDHTVELDWVAPPEDDLLGFFIYRGRSKDDFMKMVGKPLKVTTHTDQGYQGRGLRPGDTYFFGVSATDSSYNESEKTWVEVLIPDDEPPSPPISVSAIMQGEDTVAVRWQAAHSWDVTGYRVYRGLNGEEATLLASEGDSIRSLADIDINKGQRVYYYVTSVDRAGNESNATDSVRVFIRDNSAPPLPSSLRAVVEESAGVAISWDEADAADVRGYRILRSNSRTGIYTPVNDGKLVTETQYTDAEGTASHYYRIVTVDTSGNQSRRTDPVRPQASD
jgi:fibronectin type 3 domain-containing protein